MPTPPPLTVSEPLTPHNVEIKIGRYTYISRYSHYWKTCNQNVIESKL